jgi:hypothetical protein
VDVPLGTTDTTLVHRGQLAEQVTGQVDGAVIATHALVNDGTGGGLTVVLDGDGLAAVTVLHDAVGKGKDVLDSAVVGVAAGAGVGGSGGGVVESDHAVAGGTLGASAGASTDGRGRGRGRSRGGSLGSGSGSGGSLFLDDRLGSGVSLGLHGRSGGSGSGSGGRGGGGRLDLLHLLGGNSSSSNGRDDGDNGGSGLVRVDSGGDIDGSPDDIGDGLPNDGAFSEGSRVASQGEESASKGESLGDRSHCEIGIASRERERELWKD